MRRDGRYQRVTAVVGDEPYAAREPFAVTVPARLLDLLHP